MQLELAIKVAKTPRLPLSPWSTATEQHADPEMQTLKIAQLWLEGRLTPALATATAEVAK